MNETSSLNNISSIIAIPITWFIIDYDLSSHHSNDLFRPVQFLQESMIQALLVFIFVSILHLVVLELDGVLFRKTLKDESNVTNLEKWKRCSQITNMVVNLILGISGIYYVTYVLDPDPSMKDLISAHDNAVIFCIAQTGYQFWSFLVGIFYIDDSPVMLLHHFIVICVAIIPITFTNGLRHCSPFFHGVSEISSVPLAVMNIFKQNPQLAKKYPTFNALLKICFATTFLFVRVVLWLPTFIFYGRVALHLSFTCSTNLCSFYLRFFLACGFILTLMQLYWSAKIVNGLYSMLPFVTKKKKH